MELILYAILKINRINTMCHIEKNITTGDKLNLNKC